MIIMLNHACSTFIKRSRLGQKCKDDVFIDSVESQWPNDYLLCFEHDDNLYSMQVCTSSNQAGGCFQWCGLWLQIYDERCKEQFKDVTKQILHEICLHIDSNIFIVWMISEFSHIIITFVSYYLINISN
jgi:hypothetical protein